MLILNCDKMFFLLQFAIEGIARTKFNCIIMYLHFPFFNFFKKILLVKNLFIFYILFCILYIEYSGGEITRYDYSF